MAKFIYYVTDGVTEKIRQFTSAKSAEAYARQLCNDYKCSTFVSRYWRNSLNDLNYGVWFEYCAWTNEVKRYIM